MNFQTEIDQENLVLNHMTNVAVQTHQIKDRKYNMQIDFFYYDNLLQMMALSIAYENQSFNMWMSKITLNT